MACISFRRESWLACCDAHTSFRSWFSLYSWFFSSLSALTSWRKACISLMIVRLTSLAAMGAWLAVDLSVASGLGVVGGSTGWV